MAASGRKRPVGKQVFCDGQKLAKRTVTEKSGVPAYIPSLSRSHALYGKLRAAFNNATEPAATTAAVPH